MRFLEETLCQVFSQFYILDHFDESLYGEHAAKKPKMIKQSPDNTFDNITSMTGSIPSPVASQMSNMSTPNKLVNSTNGHDRSTKVKGFKVHPN